MYRRLGFPDRVFFADGFPWTRTGDVCRVEWVRLREKARPHPAN